MLIFRGNLRPGEGERRHSGKLTIMRQEAPQNIEKIPDNIEIIERAEAVYRIIYERHEGGRTKEELGHPDAFVAEYISAVSYGRPHLAESLAVSYWEQKKEEARGEGSEEAHVKSLEIPFYFIDATDPARAIDKAHIRATYLKAIETGLAGASSFLVSRELLKKQKEGMTRRQFLKIGMLGSASAYFGTNLLDLFVKLGEKLATPKGYADKARRAIINVQEKLHPETEGVMRTFRDALWAQKLQSIAQELGQALGRKPEIAFAVGKDHVGLAEMLEMPPEKRIQAIQRFLKFFGLREVETDIAAIAKLKWHETDKNGLRLKFLKTKN